MDSCEAATAAAFRAGASALTTIERAEKYKAQLEALFDCGFEWNEDTGELVDVAGAHPPALVDPDTGLWGDPADGVLPVVVFIEKFIHDLCAAAGPTRRASLSVQEIVTNIKASYLGPTSEEIIAEALTRAMAANSLGIIHSELMRIKGATR
jgi:hypothetical protein